MFSNVDLEDKVARGYRSWLLLRESYLGTNHALVNFFVEYLRTFPWSIEVLVCSYSEPHDILYVRCPHPSPCP